LAFALAVDFGFSCGTVALQAEPIVSRESEAMRLKLNNKGERFILAAF